jgi:hypothetical protein
LRFAVRGLAQWRASPRSDRPPGGRGDIDGRVYVCVAGVCAGSAPEAGLALARLPVNVPARVATLASERRVDLLHSTGRFVFESADQNAPARAHDPPVDSGLLADTAARLCGSALGRPGHVSNLQILDADYIEPACKVRTRLLRPVLSAVLLARPQFRGRDLYSLAAVGPSDSLGELPLKMQQASLFRCLESGHGQQLTGRQSGGYCHPTIHADNLAGARRCDRYGDRSECDMPAPGSVLNDPIGLHPVRHRTRPAEPDPPDLRDAQVSDVAGDSFDVGVTDGDDPESLVAPCLAPRWSAMGSGEEIRHRLPVVAQSLLLHYYRSRCQPPVIRPRQRQLAALFPIPWSAAASRAPVATLFHGKVPHEASVPAVPRQRFLLVSRGLQTVSRHANILSMHSDRTGLTCATISPFGPPL